MVEPNPAGKDIEPWGFHRMQVRAHIQLGAGEERRGNEADPRTKNHPPKGNRQPSMEGGEIANRLREVCCLGFFFQASGWGGGRIANAMVDRKKNNNVEGKRRKRRKKGEVF